GEKAWPEGGLQGLPLIDRQAVSDARRLWYQAREQLKGSLNTAGPGLGDRFSQAYQRAAAQGAYLEVLQRATDPASGLLNPRKVETLIQANPEKWMRRFGPYWEEIRPILFRGQDFPVLADVPTPIARGTGTTISRLARSALGTPYPAVYPYRAPFAVDPTTQAALDVLMQRPEMQALAIGAGQYLWPSRRTRSRTEELLEGGL